MAYLAKSVLQIHDHHQVLAVVLEDISNLAVVTAEERYYGLWWSIIDRTDRLAQKLSMEKWREHAKLV